MRVDAGGSTRGESRSKCIATLPIVSVQLAESNRPSSTWSPKVLRASKVLVDINQKAAFQAFCKGCFQNDGIYDLITRLFWLLVDCNFSLSLRGVYSTDATEADGIT